MYPEAKPRVLLLDDEQVIRGSLSRYLSAAGYDVRTAGTADDAIAVLARGSVDAAVLDVRLPGHRSGLEILQAMRVKDHGQSRVVAIILTGHDLAPDEEEIIRRCRAYVFYKPHGYEDLVARLEELLGQGVRKSAQP